MLPPRNSTQPHDLGLVYDDFWEPPKPNRTARNGFSLTRDAKTNSDACINCRWSLVNLDPNGVCPECGVSIADSLAGDSLSNAPAAHLRTIMRGATIAFIGLLLLMLAYTVNACWTIFGDASGNPTAHIAIAIPLWLITLASAACIILGLIGMTRPNPRMHASDRRSILRKFAVIAATLLGLSIAGVIVITAPVTAFDDPNNTHYPARVLFPTMLIPLASLVGLPAVAVLLRYTARLAGRLDRPDERKALCVATWAVSLFPITFVFCAMNALGGMVLLFYPVLACFVLAAGIFMVRSRLADVIETRIDPEPAT